MKWLRMLGLYFERTLEYRLRSLLWLLIPLTNNLTLILFWSGAGMNSSSISTYYILMTVVSVFTTSHIEHEVSEVDIKQGQLVNYLTKPISYYGVQLLSEFPYRVLQGVYSILILGAFLLFFPGALRITLPVWHIPLVILLFILGYLISFTFKLSIAYISFWFKDIRGLFELVTIVIIIFSGGIMPLPWYPHLLQTVCSIFPFAYSGYFIVASLQGSVPLMGLVSLLAIQGVWLGVFLIINTVLWRNGIKEFTAMGQ